MHIGILRGRGDKQQRDVTLFPINIWNVRSRVGNEQPKSKNAFEGFRNALRSFHCFKPSESIEIIQRIETGFIIFIHEKHAAASW